MINVDKRWRAHGSLRKMIKEKVVMEEQSPET
jgi:hypothetical protein